MAEEPTVLEQITAKIIEVDNMAGKLRKLLNTWDKGEITVTGDFTVSLTATVKNQMKAKAKDLCDDIATVAVQIKELIP